MIIKMILYSSGLKKLVNLKSLCNYVGKGLLQACPVHVHVCGDLFLATVGRRASCAFGLLLITFPETNGQVNGLEKLY